MVRALVRFRASLEIFFAAQPGILPSLGVFRNPSAGRKTTINTQVGGSQSRMYRETCSPKPLVQLCGKASVSGDQCGFGRNCEACLTQTIEGQRDLLPPSGVECERQVQTFFAQGRPPIPWSGPWCILSGLFQAGCKVRPWQSCWSFCHL